MGSKDVPIELSRDEMIPEAFEVEAKASNIMRSEGDRSSGSIEGAWVDVFELSVEALGIEGGRRSLFSDCRSICNLPHNAMSAARNS